MTAIDQANVAARLEAVRDRVEAMPCDRARYAPDVMEWCDGGCVHCELLALLEGTPS